MRIDAVMLRVIGMFTLLGIILFAGRETPTPPHPRESPAPAVEPIPEIEISAELIDRVETALEALETRPVRPPLYEPPPDSGFRNDVSPLPPPPLASLDPLPKALTAGRRAALRAILEGDAYVLFFGAPPGDAAEPEEPILTLIESGLRGATTSQRLRQVSIGDSIDPELAEYVYDFNLQVLHAQRSGLIRTREAAGIWSAAAHLDKDADELLFHLLDDPTDAIATAHDPETGACELDLGKRDGIERGMRFVLWTQARPLRRVLALAEVDGVTDARCNVRIVKSFSDSWPAAPGIRASNPFFHRGRKVAGYALGDKLAGVREMFMGWKHASLYDTMQFPDFCIVGDVPDREPIAALRARVRNGTIELVASESLERARAAGAIFVPQRLVRYLLPDR